MSEKLTSRPEYCSWSSMVSRCTKPNYSNYHRYGGAGITVAAEWLGRDGFHRFREHIGPRPSAVHQIDRIDSRGHYAPGNVRWATPKEQQRNRSNNVRITFDGKTLCAAEWASLLGISRTSMQRRLRRWPLERALRPGRQPPRPLRPPQG